ncbi:NfeD family protein [Halomonas saccharevitans]|uniref:Membrane-bound serine protease (ClpP class) n=1 Tax=Halomonas saccharevitans TaxID=416872 RepID=A0A1I6XNN5_9GAMM|nr:nodulation protein NfeD [Halomonas saccharevitans]SFT39384.1 membrane-bound serine protease (ClpP class) [Halomonas saccharevitans]
MMPNRPDAKRRVLFWLSLVCLALGALLAWQAQAQKAQPEAGLAMVMTIDDAIGPAIGDYFQRGLELAEEREAELVVVQMDTPGGLDASMRAMIRAMLTSPVPVALYVSPAGARAASAGTYLLYASHVAAMAPATHLGSATPVQLGGGGGLPGLSESEPETEPESEPVPESQGAVQEAADGEASQGESTQDAGSARQDESAQEPAKRRGETAMERKVLEDAVAYIRSLAERHGRNADWAERAVREAVNLTAREALEQNVIEVVASDLDDLLAQLDGRSVVMDDGERTLSTAELVVERFDPDWRTELLAVITNPNVAYFLMIIGFYGLIFELSNPGSLVPGTIGIISLLLALFAFQVLPVNYAGLALILVGLGLIVGEAMMPSFGILGIGGIVAFVIGSVILMDADTLNISLPMIGGIALLAAGLMLWVMTRFIGLRRRPPRIGQEELVGSEALVLEDFTDQGHVRLMGERWRARSPEPLARGQLVRVTAVDGLTLEVEPLASSS